MSTDIPSEKNITAFNGIFTARLNKIIKDIKKVRRDPTKKDKLKSLLQEAKHLKHSIKTSNKKQHYNISTTYEINEDGMILFDTVNLLSNNGVKVVDIFTSVNNTSDNHKTFTINFIIKQQ
jgi:hypothetical protein